MGNVSTVTTDGVACRLAPLSGLLLLAAVLCGLLAMHGLQPSPGPLPTPSVLALHSAQTDHSAMPMAGTRDRHGDTPGSPHQGHGGGQVCLALLLAGSVLLLLLVIVGAGRFGAPPSRLFLQSFLPRGPTARPRGPTLAQLCVIRV
ncbi:DUF6153 family protein [Microbispora sp. NPDC046973]|uniref:DUF6153 family protein n=1 Tax=Microbispora sp. NPDC046973 TaxID=3155022 RepID=UPI0034055487